MTAQPSTSARVSNASSELLNTSDPRLQALHHWLSGLSSEFSLDMANWAPASADASFRRYFRIGSHAPAHPSLIVMDAPPPQEDCRPFVHVAQLLEEAGLQAPKVLAEDLAQGFLLLTDLGRETYLDVLTEDNARPLMRAALDALIVWQKSSRTDVLPAYDTALLKRELDLFPDWYIGKHLKVELSESQRATLDRINQLLIDSALAQPKVFVHRDYMPRNLMPGLPGTTGPGILDFQDAVYGPLTYDVISLMRDAFLSWDEERQLDWLAYYWERARKAGLPVDADFGEFYRQAEWMGLQRHLKVLGIFARINYRDGKPRYLADTPRFLDYARKVADRYAPLRPLAKLLDELTGQQVDVGYTFEASPMKAMIFAAGRGERMRPLTDAMPKPLLTVGGKPIIVWQIEALARAGFTQIVINHAWLGAQIEATLGDGSAFGVHLTYSAEAEALETAGGIAQARALLEGDGNVLLAVSGDIFTDFDYATLRAQAERLAAHTTPGMHLVMVPNPAFHPTGDFALDAAGHLFLRDAAPATAESLTFGNIALYDLRLFDGIAPGTRMALTPLYQRAIAAGHASGERFDGIWENVGTPAQLDALDAEVRAGHARSPGSRIA